MSDTRADRVKALYQATHEYVEREKKRINDEVSTLKGILSGRTGGAGAGKIVVEKASAVAYDDLSQFLKGA